jgi:hypothetical protein
MIDKNFKSLGFKDMHDLQVKTLMEFVAMAVNLATLTEDSEIIDDVTEYADELVKLFGGNGVRLTIEVDAQPMR